MQKSSFQISIKISYKTYIQFPANPCDGLQLVIVIIEVIIQGQTFYLVSSILSICEVHLDDVGWLYDLFAVAG